MIIKLLKIFAFIPMLFGLIKYSKTGGYKIMFNLNVYDSIIISILLIIILMIVELIINLKNNPRGGVKNGNN